MANGIIEHRDDYHFFIVREAYIIICQLSKYRKPDTEKSKCKASPHCKAFILSILENWTNDKRAKKQSLAVFMTYKQWADAMYGIYGRNVIIDSLDELIGEGLIRREPYKMYGKDTFQYFLNYEELNKRIKQLPKVASHEDDPFTSKRDTDTSEDTTRLQVNPTRLQVNEDAFTSNHNIDTNLESNIEERAHARRELAPSAKRKPNAHSQGVSSLSQEEKQVLQTYAEAKGRAISYGPRNIEGAQQLKDVQPTVAQLRSAEAYCLTFLKNGVDLLDIARHWDKWESTQQDPITANDDQSQPPKPLGTDFQRRMREQMYKYRGAAMPHVEAGA